MGNQRMLKKNTKTVKKKLTDASCGDLLGVVSPSFLADAVCLLPLYLA